MGGGHDACVVVGVLLLVVGYGSPDPLFDAQQELVDVLVGGRREPVELEPSVLVGVEDAVWQPGMCVRCQLKDAAPELQHGHGAWHGGGDAVLAGTASLVGEHVAQKERD